MNSNKHPNNKNISSQAFKESDDYVAPEKKANDNNNIIINDNNKCIYIYIYIYIYTHILQSYNIMNVLKIVIK